MQVDVTRVYMGSLMTSLEMAGVSLTLLKASSSWEESLGEEIYMCRHIHLRCKYHSSFPFSLGMRLTF